MTDLRSSHTLAAAPSIRARRRVRTSVGLFLAMSVVSAAMTTLALPTPGHAAPAIAWHQGIKWVPFDQALTRAKAENKAVCVVVYADWCPKCRSLAPRFAEQPILKASDDVIMVLQNSDERPAWLKQKFGDLGNYVPRVFFLKPDGSVSTDVNSGNARFPYFYRASEAAKLAGSIARAAKAAGPVTVAPPQPVAAAVPAVAAPAPPAPTASQPATAGGLFNSSDAPLLALLAAVAVGAVWFVGRKSDGGDGAAE